MHAERVEIGGRERYSACVTLDDRWPGNADVSLGHCKDRAQGEQVIGDMVDTSNGFR